jgi:hypothetical protein
MAVLVARDGAVSVMAAEQQEEQWCGASSMMRSEVGNGGGAMGHGFDDSPWAAMDKGGRCTWVLSDRGKRCRLALS